MSNATDNLAIQTVEETILVAASIEDVAVRIAEESLAVSQSVEQINVSINEEVLQFVIDEVLQPLVTEDEVPYEEEIDKVDVGNDTYYYKGQALPGTATSAAAWRIRLTIVYSNGDVSKSWADGNSNFDKVWDDRLTYSY